MNSSKARYFLEVALVVFVMILQLIWPLPGTIALRNMCLIGGAISSLLLIFFFQEKIKSNIPTFLLLLVPAWLLAHYFLIPVDLKQQWYDLSGTWLRVVLGIFTAFSLGGILVQKPQWIKWIYLPYVILALITLFLFFYAAFKESNWVVLNFVGVFKTKIYVAYFSFFTCLTACGLLLLKNDSFISKSSFIKLSSIYISIIILCFANCINTQSLIGFLFCVLVSLIAIFIFTFKSMHLNDRHSKLASFLLILATLCAIAIFYEYDKNYEGKLFNLKNDVIISLDLDKNKTWSRSTSVAGMPDPVDVNGRSVNISTYERTSWFLKGLQTLIAHPLGSGFSWSAFRYYMLIEYPGTKVAKTHSGWLDFALGVGLPGLLLTWSAIFLILRQAFTQLNTFHHHQSIVVIFFLIGMSFFWLVAEVSEREFIEHFFFFIALTSSYISHIKLRHELTSFHSQ